MSADTKYLLETRHLKKYFNTPRGLLHAVDDVDLAIRPGQTLGVVGESGCGKSTLGRAVLRLLEPTSGEVLFDGEDVTKMGKPELKQFRNRAQIIFQDPYASLNPRMTVYEIIAEPLVAGHLRKSSAELEHDVFQMMDTVGLAARLVNAYPHELDGGRRQRIGIARALVLQPQFIVCDEPVSALDVSIQAQIINLLKQLQKDFGFTYLFISHDLSVVEHISDTVGVMYLGSMVEYADTDKIFAHPLHPYTEALFSAIPIPDPDVKMKRIILKGSLPSPANPPKGCKFHTRCHKCMEVCKYAVPEWAEVEPEHWCACHLYDDAERKARAEQAMAEAKSGKPAEKNEQKEAV